MSRLHFLPKIIFRDQANFGVKRHLYENATRVHLLIVRVNVPVTESTACMQLKQLVVIVTLKGCWTI